MDRCRPFARRWRPSQIVSGFFLLVGMLAAFIPASAHAATNAIVTENQNPGNSDWLTTKPAHHSEIEGYASQVSAVAGDTVRFFVNTSAASYTVSLYRMGWYSGAGARLIARYGPLPGIQQTIPVADPNTGFIECNWQSQLTIPISSDWTTGLYLFRLERPDGYQSYVPLIIRASQQTSDLLFQCSTTTYQAYNQWGGESLYFSATGGTTRRHAYEVSFDRPYDSYDSYAPGAGEALMYEYPTLRWLERQGYDVSYACDNDIHENGAMVLNHKMFLSVGHDEYYSKQMYDALLNARDQGTSLMFWSANTCFWQIRFDASPVGSDRRIICYKDAYINDPQYGVDNSLVTTNFANELIGRPENGLIGVRYNGYEHTVPYAPFNLRLAGDPEFSTITVPPPASAPVIAGYEFDGIQRNGATPPAVEVLSNSTVVTAQILPGICQSVRYTAPSGARVFAAGTIAWGWGLDGWRTVLEKRGDQSSNAIQQLAATLISDGLQPPTPTGAVPISQIVQVIPSTNYMAPGQSMTYLATVGGRSDGAGVTWSIAEGSKVATVDSGGYVQVAPSVPDGTQIHLSASSVQYPSSSALAVITVNTPRTWKADYFAGTGNNRYLDGPATTAEFVTPGGMVTDAQGNIYIADTSAQAIRMISGGIVSTLAGGTNPPSGQIPVKGGFTDGQGTAAQFLNPFGLAMMNGQLYVTDASNHAIRIVTTSGVVTTLTGNGKPGYVDGAISQARFNVPTGIAIDSKGVIFIADTANHAIRRITPTGDVFTVAGTGAPGFVDGPNGVSQLYYPYGLAWTNAGLVIADAGNHAIRLLRSDNSLITLAGTGLAGYQDGAAASAQFTCPVGVLAMPGGAIWITDRGNNVIRALDPTGATVTTVLGSGVASQLPGADLAAQFMSPVSLASAPDGSVYLADASEVYRTLPLNTASGLAYLDILPSTIAGSLSAVGKVTLNGVANAQTVVSLSTTNPAVGIPATVVIPQGSISATFTITTQAVTSTVSGSMTATLNGVRKSASITVRPIYPLALSLNPLTVVGGQASTGTVTLEAPAAPNDITVTLNSSDPTATVPGSITIPAGSASGSFSVATTAVSSNKSVTITATANGQSVSRSLGITPPGLAGLTVSPTNVTGSLNATGTVTMNAVPLANTVVSLSSANAAASVPASVTVPAGSSSASFTITTQAVTTTVSGNIVATLNGVTAIASLTVKTIGPQSLALSPDKVVGGQNSTGTVTLEAPAAPGNITVTLTSSNAAATVPGSITIPAGSTTGTFTINTTAVTTSTNATITASVSGRSVTKTLTILPNNSTLAGLTVSPTTVAGSLNATGTVTLSAPAVSDTAVTLSSANAAASVPASVTVPAGSSSASFTITTQAVTSTVTGNIKATLGSSTASATLSVRAIGPLSLALSPDTVVGGQSSTGTVTLEAPAAPGNITVTFTSSNPAATVPASITIPAGSSTGTFTINTTAVSATKNITITATANGRSVTKTLTVK